MPLCKPSGVLPFSCRSFQVIRMTWIQLSCGKLHQAQRVGKTIWFLLKTFKAVPTFAAPCVSTFASPWELTSEAGLSPQGRGAGTEGPCHGILAWGCVLWPFMARKAAGDAAGTAWHVPRCCLFFTCSWAGCATKHHRNKFFLLLAPKALSFVVTANVLIDY